MQRYELITCQQSPLERSIYNLTLRLALATEDHDDDCSSIAWSFQSPSISICHPMIQLNSNLYCLINHYLHSSVKVMSVRLQFTFQHKCVLHKERGRRQLYVTLRHMPFSCALADGLIQIYLVNFFGFILWNKRHARQTRLLQVFTSNVLWK